MHIITFSFSLQLTQRAKFLGILMISVIFLTEKKKMLLFWCYISIWSDGFRLHFIRFLSDLKGPDDDLICLERINVLTGLVFEEGGESPFCLLK